MFTEYVWASPGGVYVVPDDFKRMFLAEFPEYRIRWSLSKNMWQIEQEYGRGALPTMSQNHFNDDRIRREDGYWLVMQLAPGSHIDCPTHILGTNQTCGTSLKIPYRWLGELRCRTCFKAGRDGRTVAGHWPFDATLMDKLREGDPNRRGYQRIEGKDRVMAAVNADRANEATDKERDRKASDAVTSIDAVDHRWMTGIASSSGLRRQTIAVEDLL